jgi:PAS domain S-box-containing protein
MDSIDSRNNEAGKQEMEYAISVFQKEVNIHTLLESLGQGVIVINEERTILFVNKRGAQMYGYDAFEIVGKSHDMLVPPRYFSLHIKNINKYLKDPKIRPMGIGMDLHGIRKDGSEFPVEISLSFVNTQNGLVVVSLMNDISIRKEMEEALRVRAEELAQLNNELEAFSYSVSHDLKAPLRTLIGFSDILLEDYSDVVDKSGREFITRIKINAQKMNDLIDDILKLSRISRQEMITEETDLSELANAIFTDFKRNQPQRNVEVIIQKEMIAKVDKKLINIAFLNLFGNAWKFTMKREHARIEFGYMGDYKHKVYFIKDNGAGFDMKHSGEIFAPFRRLHSESDFPGTGIGLAIVERTITRHGGKVWAESTPGAGATFYFTIKD